jgi:glycerol-3-phosphate dehydrogenase (NAD(P)+)
VNFNRTAVIGAGAWGTALAVLWSDDARDIMLWGHRPELIEQMRSARENSDYLPSVKLPANIGLTNSLHDCAGADLIAFVTPSRALREIATCLREAGVARGAVLLSGTKGIEHGTGNRMTQILQEIYPNNPVAALSGPNLAVEVSRAQPTAAVLACSTDSLAVDLQLYLGRPRFRIYRGDDLAGIELGGALKNIFAIAAGASDGLGLGDNTKAALITRALAEMVRLGTAMGGSVSTFYGLSGTGDLIATCFSKLSRNRRVGEQLGRGLSLDQITSKMRTVAEGIPTAESAYESARRLNIDTPIIDQIYGLLFQGRAPAQAMEDLLGRDPKPERI